MVNSKNKSRGLYFSKALFEGLIFGGAFGGAYIWRVFCVTSLGGLFSELYRTSCNMQRSGHIQSKPIQSFHKDVLNEQEKMVFSWSSEMDSGCYYLNR